MGFVLYAIVVDAACVVGAEVGLVFYVSLSFSCKKVFVLDDGGETDLDLGNYERFMGVNLKNESNLTTGYLRTRILLHSRREQYCNGKVYTPVENNAIAMEIQL